MGIEHDQLVNKVNQQLLDLGGMAAPSEFQKVKRDALEKLMRRYLEGERSEELFAAMKITVKKI